VRILEGAGLVATEKVGVRFCRAGLRGLVHEADWIDRSMLQDRLDRLDHSWSVRKPGHREAKGKPS
jgi:hypothetical protein